MQKEELTHEKIHAEIAKLIAETGRINSETTKINTENKFYPLVLCTAFGSAFTVAVFAVLRLYV